MSFLWAAFGLTALAMALGAWFGRKQLLEHPIRAFALLLIAAIVGYIMFVGYRANEVLAGAGWCRTALGAEQASAQTVGKVQGLDACVGLLQIQLKSVSTNSHIYAGSLAMSQLVLVVILLAGGKLAFSVSKTGVSGNVGKDEVAEAADKVAGAAADKAEEIKQDVTPQAAPTPPPAPAAIPEPEPEHSGPAMPPPP